MKSGPLQSKHARNRLIKLGVVSVVGIVIAVVLGIVASNLFVSVSETVVEASHEELEIQATGIAGRLASSIEAIDAGIAQALDDGSIAALIRARDPDAIRAREAELLALFKDAISVRLFLPGLNTTDAVNVPPIGYASLDAIRRAERGASEIPVELHQIGTDNEHILIVRRIQDDAGAIAGIFWMAAGVSIVHTLLDEVDPGANFIALNQVGGGVRIRLAAVGEPPIDGVPPTVRKAVAGAAWQIAIWDEHAGAQLAQAQSRGGSSLGLIFGIVVALGAVGAVWFVFRGRTRKKVAAKPQFGGAISEIQAGHHPGAAEHVPGMVVDGSKPAAAPPAPAVAPAPAAAEVAAPPDSPAPDAPPAVADGPAEVPASIFRAYDIRGIVGQTLSPEIVRQIGQAIGSEAFERGQQGVIVARDGRNSGPELMEALIAGLRSSGQDVIDIGMVPTPVLYYATHYLETGSGVMLTGSHNPPDYNGLKITLGGESLSGEAITSLYKRITDGDMRSGNGSLQAADIAAEYIRRICEDIPVALGNSMKIIVDCGNGVAGVIAPQLMRALGHDVVELYCDVDGDFPNHHPDPSQPANLEDVIKAVKDQGADLGLAFDGDGDRIGVIDNRGNIIWPDSLMILYARDVLSRNPGAEIIFDVKCSTHLGTAIKEAGGNPVMWKTGHSIIKARMKKTGALLAGEMSGHIFFKERWYGFDDATYAAARLLEILMNSGKPSSEVFAELPVSISTPELRIDMDESEHAAFMQALIDKGAFGDATVITIDGLRAEFANGWGLIRPSNTTPCLIMRFEADSELELSNIQEQFRDVMKSVKPDLVFPY